MMARGMLLQIFLPFLKSLIEYITEVIHFIWIDRQPWNHNEASRILIRHHVQDITQAARITNDKKTNPTCVLSKTVHASWQ